MSDDWVSHSNMNRRCLQLPDKTKWVRYARKLDLCYSSPFDRCEQLRYKFRRQWFMMNINQCIHVTLTQSCCKYIYTIHCILSTLFLHYITVRHSNLTLMKQIRIEHRQGLNPKQLWAVERFRPLYQVCHPASILLINKQQTIAVVYFNQRTGAPHAVCWLK